MMNTALATTEFFRPSSSAHLAIPEAAKALERAWQRRRQELAGWQPSNGWLIDARVAHKGTRTPR
jgi:hypothetical protein